MCVKFSLQFLEMTPIFNSKGLYPHNKIPSKKLKITLEPNLY